MSLVFLFGGRATMLGGGVSSVANLCLRFVRCDSDELASARFQLDRHRLNRHQKLKKCMLKFVWSSLNLAQNHPVNPRDTVVCWDESEEVCLVWNCDFAEH